MPPPPPGLMIVVDPPPPLLTKGIRGPRMAHKMRMQTHPRIRFIFAFCLHMCRFVARAVLWNVFAWLASSADLFSRTSVLSIFASMTSTFSCLRGGRGAEKEGRREWHR